ncbi:MAG: AmmeMemoRadiSam system protein B [Methanopyri archaeon]|nr:AmmeMemoRadiSam system protein B [Methanopyri archaeon]
MAISTGSVRRPAVAGQFYPADPDSLVRQIEECFVHPLGPGEKPRVRRAPCALPGVVCPHAGYMYSGPVAAHSYKALAEAGIPETVVILGPNHTGLGTMVATMTSGAWRTPLGDVPIDSEFAERLVMTCDVMDDDPTAHMQEHSIEVQLPFLQYLYGDSFRFVPICMMSVHDVGTAREVGRAIVEVAEALGRNVVVIASTDLTHYEPQDVAREKDTKVLKTMEALDEEALVATVERYDVSMCGVDATAAAMVAAKGLGAVRGEVLKYATSGDVTGDYTQVVGYASVAFLPG